jgi:hypothetical protein
MNTKDALQLADSIDPHDFNKSCEKHDKFDLAWALRVLAGAYRRLQISHNMKSKIFCYGRPRYCFLFSIGLCYLLFGHFHVWQLLALCSSFTT